MTNLEIIKNMNDKEMAIFILKHANGWRFFPYTKHYEVIDTLPNKMQMNTYDIIEHWLNSECTEKLNEKCDCIFGVLPDGTEITLSEYNKNREKYEKTITENRHCPNCGSTWGIAAL